MRPRTPAGAALLLLGCGLLMAFVVAEVALRIHNPLGSRIRGNSVVLPVNETYVIDDRMLAGLEGLDAHVVHRKNSLGFRGEEMPGDYAERLSLITVGGSTTESFYISDGKTWPDLLASKLVANFPKLWLNNAGLDGHSTYGHALLIRNTIGPLRPRVVLLLVGLNDMFSEGPNKYDRAATGSFWGVLADYSELASTALNLYRARQTAKMTALGTIPKPHDLRQMPRREVDAGELQALVADSREGLLAYRQRLEQIIEMLNDEGIRTVLITQPSLLGAAWDDYTSVDLGSLEVDLGRHKLNGSATWTLLDKFNDVTRDLAREHNVPLIDLAREMPKTLRYYYDFFHFNNDGSVKVAAIVYRDLCPLLAAAYASHLNSGCGDDDAWSQIRSF